MPAEPELVEQDHPNVRLIFVAVVAIVTIVAVVIGGLVQLFNSTMRAEVQRKQLEPVSSVLRDVYAAEQAKLNRYQWTDQKAGILRIPIERARQLVLSEYALFALASPERVSAPNQTSAGSELAASATATAASGSATAASAPKRGEPVPSTREGDR